jgi:cytochrome c-type biogenesis protein CcmH
MTAAEIPILFWGLLVLVALTGLAFVLPPLLGGGRWLAYLLAGLLPALAGGLYLLLGTPEALTAPGAMAESAAEPGVAPSSAGEPAAEDGDALKARLPMLEARVREAPDDGEAWSLLARAYSALGRYPDAVPAFVEASRRLPGDARLWSGYAEALAITRGHVIEGEPYQLALKAVEIDMNDPKGLEVLGIYHFQQGNYGQASFYWRRLVKLLPPESDFARDIAAAAAEATARARAASDAPVESAAEPPPASAPQP